MRWNRFALGQICRRIDPRPIGDPLSLLDTSAGSGLDLNVLIRVGLSGEINLL
ncbi:MAG: hypothetical protein ACRDYF_18555 [Acidimicrobiia bacterium]